MTHLVTGSPAKSETPESDVAAPLPHVNGSPGVWSLLGAKPVGVVPAVPTAYWKKRTVADATVHGLTFSLR